MYIGNLEIMKRFKKFIFIISLLLPLLFFTNNINAQTGPPPPPGGGHGQHGSHPGGSAPLGGGLFILMGLGIAYGGKKWQDYKNSESGGE